MRATTDDGASIAWAEDGPGGGEPLLLLHSLGSNRSMWDPQLETLAVGFRVVRLDTRGHGESSVSPAPYTLERLGNDVITVADAAGLDRFHVAGVSLGGLIALWLGGHHPQRLLSLTAANTAAKIGDRDFWNGRIQTVRSRGLSVIADQVIPRWFSPSFKSGKPDSFRKVVDIFANTDPEGYVGCCAALAEADLRQAVPSLEVPALVIGSTLDLSTPVTQAEWLHEQLPNSRLAVIEGAGHLSNLDRDHEFTRILVDFLQESP